MSTNLNLNITGSVTDVGDIVNNITSNYTIWIIVLSAVLLLGLGYLLVHRTTVCFERRMKKDVLDHHGKITEGHQKIIEQQHLTIDDMTKDMSKKIDTFIGKNNNEK